MNTIIERITEAIKDILIGLIKSCLDNMFTSVNEQVGTIAGQVGQTPQGWNAGIFNLIQNISQTVIVPIAGLIITFVLCYELITMVILISSVSMDNKNKSPSSISSSASTILVIASDASTAVFPEITPAALLTTCWPTSKTAIVILNVFVTR